MCKADEKKQSTYSGQDWENKIEEVKDCSKSPAGLLVYITPLVSRKIDILMKKYRTKEWLGYLFGEKFPDKAPIVKDLVIPKQVATSARVDDIEYTPPVGMSVIGVIHSHHTMGAFFSGTDHAYINQNHDISIVVSTSGAKAHLRWRTPCGAYKIVDAKVKLLLDTNFDVDAFLKEVEENIQEPIVRTYRYTDDYYGGYFGGGFCPDESAARRDHADNRSTVWNTGRQGVTVVVKELTLRQELEKLNKKEDDAPPENIVDADEQDESTSEQDLNNKVIGSTEEMENAVETTAVVVAEPNEKETGKINPVNNNDEWTNESLVEEAKKKVNVRVVTVD